MDTTKLFSAHRSGLHEGDYVPACAFCILERHPPPRENVLTSYYQTIDEIHHKVCAISDSLKALRDLMKEQETNDK